MHKPVLLKEIVECLNPKPGQKFIDATINGGGHAMAILEMILPDGKLLGIEWDGELLKQLIIKKQDLGIKDENLILINDSYVNLKKIAEENDFTDANGILFDLGMSSWQIEEAGRGFTFMKDEPLDMRFAYPNINHQPSTASPTTAEEIVNRYSYDELVKILKEYGEERFARLIVANIINARKRKPIKTTFELVEIIKKSVPFWYRSDRRRLHFATKTFQALRIAVNDELENLKSGLEQGMEILKVGGRIAVISFHSLEDRAVKNFFRAKAKEKILKIITKKPINAELAEIIKNPRARSAKLRIAEKESRTRQVMLSEHYRIK
ncbi:MAG: 16S rRNA (cytosine(1402)-N(4))-methyltransferase RsmH [Candidatus Yanofskybacteria bacterium]|nr:16S rRNA (cytosine(1402)-N(4))-methyltransferase RsmH [Candidatus Yanofskybacteria bacterium]